MVKTVKRRLSDPHIILQLWEAITCVRQQRQVANMDRIVRFMERNYGVAPKETQRQIGMAVDESLLVKELSTAKRGSRAGVTQDGFWCAEERAEESEEPHDWYCFKCHRGGEVLCCGTCYRVYHPSCVQVEDPEKILSIWICPHCERCKKKSVSTSKWELNKILLHVISRMKDKARDLTKKLNLNELPNYYNLVYHHVDLATMMQKLIDKKYRSLEDFQGDAEALIHVAAVYYGLDSERVTLCKLTLEDCLYDLSEIRLCKDCYIMSNDRTQKDWFCKPCSPSHELVWAQMTGFGYWPAKVLQRNEDKVDVRFFGSRHQRAWIDDIHVMDINTDRKKLKIKLTQGWRSAVEELRKYQASCEGSKRKSGQQDGLSPSRRKRKHKEKSGANKELADGIVDGPSVAEDGEEKAMEVEENCEKGGGGEDDGDDQSEARHVVRLSSTTDAGQDHSVSTSQTSPEALDESALKKLKPDKEELTPTKEEPETLEENKAEEVDGEKRNDDSNPLPPLPMEEKSGEDVTDALSELRTKLEAEHRRKVEKATKEAVDKAKQEWQAERERLLKEAKEKLAAEIQKTKTETEQRCKKECAEETQKLMDEISQTKKKQWCINCEKEAMYHCCWNTSYCSISCQQVHWHQEHKRLCRRKR